MTYCAIFVVLIIVGAYIKVPVPVVPFTLQFFFTTMAGMLLGRKLGTLSVIIYTLLGLLGIPVFTSGGGIGYIFVPSFGYIIGFIAGTYVTGLIIEKISATGIYKYVIAAFAGLSIVYAMGMVYYYIIANYVIGNPIGIKALILYCFLLAVPGDIVLCILSAVAAPKIKRCLNYSIA